eukprot:CAMPEP_0197072040 /NCGR_PEP_ID=MMETSP1384-20130603/209895_1 /TAXON_ID=29189 /ORGANISM="Ammonia sp." /LENGTH=782 /DNA_ID=CAMNT_0042510853 /DNA_START=136 /DNA_END=2484 /DNA_ORIENTATION=-
MGGCCSSGNQAGKTNVARNDDTKALEADTGSVEEESVAMDKQFLETLKEIPLLSSISEADQRKLAKRLEERKFAAGDKLMAQGDVGTEFFIIAKGRCKVVVANDDGKEVEIAQLAPGDYCGEQALLKDARRGATVQAMEDTQCLVLNQSAFRQITTENNIRFATRDAKRMAISAEKMDQFKSKDEEKADDDRERPDEETTKWLLKSVEENILFSHLDEEQRLIVCSEMYRQSVASGEKLITQGEEGNTFYVVQAGEFVITVQDVGQVDTLSSGRCVGELALLYNAPRAATVQCTSSEGGAVWGVDRAAFRKALMDVHTKSSNENISTLKKCELLQSLLSSELQLIDQALELQEFKQDDVIFKTGDEGDRFYIIKSGSIAGSAKDGTQFTLSVGGFFGERALLTNEPRAATITCSSEKVECLTLSREDFNTLLGPLDDIMQRNLAEYEKPEAERKPIGHGSGSSKEQSVCALDEFKIVGILGRGAFGTVKLVTDPNSNESYALKAIRKNQVVELGQQSHILNEKKVMQMLDCPFLVNLRGTYKDEYRVYFLLEVCLGGELFTILRKMRSFDEPTAKFYSACVVEAFNYMHDRDIIYRDLKPENLVLTDTGYLKVTDFGFAKIVPNKTFTLCGTPDYLAPEIVTGQGHGKGVDWWTLGILVYEMLASFPPFFDDEPMMTYRKIIQGKFKFPRYLSAPAKDLISKFLKPKATKRLGVIKGGAELIRSHDWFKEFDWSSLQQQNMKPPIKNKVKSQKDLSNFDHFQDKQEDLEYKGDPDLGWDADF